jgi:histone arginine demethylase JMJD6
MAFEIERRSGVPYAEFAERYLYGNRPVILTDALKHWKAVSRWTPEFFKTQFGDFRFKLADDMSRYGGSSQPAVREFTMSTFIDTVLNSTEDQPAPYFRNQIVAQMFPTLVPEISPLPEYCFPNWLGEHYLVPQLGKALNQSSHVELYIGGRGASFPVLHWDNNGIHAFLMQIYGRKEFIIYPPDQTSLLYPSPAKPNRSLLDDIDQPDLTKFPLFAKATPTTFVLEPGEMLFIPSMWWHTTRMLTPCISISVNTINRSNWREFATKPRGNVLMSTAVRAYLAGAGAWRSWRDRKWSAESAARA